MGFCIVGTLLLGAEAYGVFYLRVALLPADRMNPDADVADDKLLGVPIKLIPAIVTLAVIFLEDIPQLFLQNIYFQTLGFDNADSIAIFAFVCSCISFALNLVAASGECFVNGRQYLRDRQTRRSMPVVVMSALRVNPAYQDTEP